MKRPGAIALWVVAVLTLLGAARPVSRAPQQRRELPDAPLVLVINIPAFRLDVYEHGERTRSYTVAVGGPGHETPSGSYRILRAVWNPWWHPPDSPWARKEKVTPPGPNNPMGRVKLFFGDLLYIHGTPLEGTLTEPASHGCVRMRNADVVDLAHTVHRYGTPTLSQRAVDRLAKGSTTRTLVMQRRIPLLIEYRIAEVRSGHLVLYPDVYGRSRTNPARLARKALSDAGYDVSELDEARLAIAAEWSRLGYIVVPLRELLPAAALAAGRENGARE